MFPSRSFSARTLFSFSIFCPRYRTIHYFDTQSEFWYKNSILFFFWQKHKKTNICVTGDETQTNCIFPVVATTNPTFTFSCVFTTRKRQARHAARGVLPESTAVGCRDGDKCCSLLLFLPRSCFVRGALILREFEELAFCPEGLFDAYIGGRGWHGSIMPPRRLAVDDIGVSVGFSVIFALSFVRSFLCQISAGALCRLSLGNFSSLFFDLAVALEAEGDAALSCVFYPCFVDFGRRAGSSIWLLGLTVGGLAVDSWCAASLELEGVRC